MRLRELSPSGVVGTGIVLGVVAIALFGPVFFSGSTEIVGRPFMMPTPGHPLGLDGYGRDVLTRLMNGGFTILLLVTATTALVYAVGAPVGLFTALHSRALSASALWLFDCLLAFPPLLLVLLLAASTAGGVTAAVIAVAASQVPWVTRLVRAAASEVATSGYVDAARLRGESTWSIMWRELLPNIRATMLADLGLRITVSILLITSASFLGVGLRPPTADWGLMAAENRNGLALQPWAVLAPAAMIALLTVGVNLMFDAWPKTSGRRYGAELPENEA